MATYAVVINNVVWNLVEWDGISPSILPQGAIQALVPASVAVNPGWTWNNGSPVNPNPPPIIVVPPPVIVPPDPAVVTKLAAVGLTLAQLKAALALS